MWSRARKNTERDLSMIFGKFRDHDFIIHRVFDVFDTQRVAVKDLTLEPLYLLLCGKALQVWLRLLEEGWCLAVPQLVTIDKLHPTVYIRLSIIAVGKGPNIADIQMLQLFITIYLNISVCFKRQVQIPSHLLSCEHPTHPSTIPLLTYHPLTLL